MLHQLLPPIALDFARRIQSISHDCAPPNAFAYNGSLASTARKCVPIMIIGAGFFCCHQSQGLPCVVLAKASAFGTYGARDSNQINRIANWISRQRVRQTLFAKQVILSFTLCWHKLCLRAWILMPKLRLSRTYITLRRPRSLVGWMHARKKNARQYMVSARRVMLISASRSLWTWEKKHM